ncbi:BioH protein [Desulfobacca acetoxidans DSM 11109]|uniref:BioH protein n=1 Tax=Desulfobacca acetoxidans (strain ATCC 700848 / DSM 11109 / ASRB2) TaxID=880072 RepID=F2NFZ4_DESAR|nr:BioH protein [Desulfobacca acetoxidans DSM 11109]
MEAHDPGQTILVGWSLGGMLALEVCAAGFRPRAVVTIAACASFCRRPDYGLGVPAAVLRAMRQRLTTEPEQVIRDFHSRLLSLGERNWQETVPALLPERFNGAWLAQGLDYLRRKDLRSILSEAKAEEFVIVHGFRDRITPVSQAYVLAEQLPSARLIILPSAGHIPLVTQSQVVNDLIMEFL